MLTHRQWSISADNHFTRPGGYEGRKVSNMEEFAVYRDGVGDNDQMDWSLSYKEAFETAEEMASNLAEGECLYLSKVIDGQFEDFPLKFKMEDGQIHQYKGKEHLWL